MTATEGRQERPTEITPSRSRALGGYRTGLDGMRGVGMAFMLAFHAEFSWARGAFLALSQFFTLSGFLVTTMLLQTFERRGGIPLREFWSRRARRLLPASLIALAGAVVFGATVATRQQADALPTQIAAAAANVSNWLFIANDTSYVGQFTAPSPVQHFWSLSVEEQFYLILPLALLGMLAISKTRRRLAYMVGGAMVTFTAWMILLNARGASVDRLYYGTDTRMPEMLAGALLAVVLASPRIDLHGRKTSLIAWGGGLIYLVSLSGFVHLDLTYAPMWWGGTLVFALMTCAGICAILTSRGPLRVLELWPIAAMGRISYGLYLYHLPIFLWLTSTRTGLSQWPLFLLRLAVTFAAAIASYHLIEQPIRHGASFWPKRAAVIIGPAAAVLIVLAGFVFIGRSAPDPLATLRSETADAPGGPEADPVTDVLVLTDGTGEAVGQALRNAADDDPSLVVHDGGPFTCGAMAQSDAGRGCATWLETWPQQIDDIDPDVVLVYADDLSIGSSGASLGELTEVLGNGFDLLSANGAPVVWASPGGDVATALRRKNDPFHNEMQHQ